MVACGCMFIVHQGTAMRGSKPYHAPQHPAFSPHAQLHPPDGHAAHVDGRGGGGGRDEPRQRGQQQVQVLVHRTAQRLQGTQSAPDVVVVLRGARVAGRGEDVRTSEGRAWALSAKCHSTMSSPPIARPQ